MISTMLLPVGQPLLSPHTPNLTYREPISCRQQVTCGQPFVRGVVTNPMLSVALPHLGIARTTAPPLLNPSAIHMSGLAHRDIQTIRAVQGWRSSVPSFYRLSQPTQHQIEHRTSAAADSLNSVAAENWLKIKLDIQSEVAKKLGFRAGTPCSWMSGVETATSGKRLFLVFDGESNLFKKEGVFSHRDFSSIPVGTEVLVARVYRSPRSTSLLGHCTRALMQPDPCGPSSFNDQIDHAVEAWYEYRRIQHARFSRSGEFADWSTSAGDESVGNQLINELEEDI